MSKCVLVIDMPSSCSKCKFMYEFYGVKKCHLLNILEKGGKAIIPTDTLTTGKKECCPLRELPENNVEDNKNYEEEIYKLALTIQDKPEVLKMLLRNYDELVKKIYLPEIQESMKKYPFWNYFCVFDDELLKGEEG